MAKTSLGFVGTDGRSFLAALETSRATRDLYPGDSHGVVVRGTPAMPPFAEKMQWPVDFIPVAENNAEAYGEALIRAFGQGTLDLALIMPEALLFNGLVDLVAAAGFGERMIGLDRRGDFIEADKIACKRLCREAGIPVAPEATLGAVRWLETEGPEGQTREARRPVRSKRGEPDGQVSEHP